MFDEDFDGLAVHAGEKIHSPATSNSICVGSAFEFRNASDAAQAFVHAGSGLPASESAYIYTRWRNPTVDRLEAKVAALEGAEDCVAFASGMAALHAVFRTSVRCGAHILAADSMYAETRRLLVEAVETAGVTVSFVDTTNMEAIAEAWQPNTRLIHLETPANPTLAITDVAAVSAFAHGREALVSVDGTFATPFHQRPLLLGADFSIHSATKGLCGHGDAVGGVVSGDRERIESVRRLGVRSMGAALSPFAAYLIARGIQTLGVRMRASTATASWLAHRLAAHPAVSAVYYPGLPEHPGHAIAERQMTRGFGSLLAFELEGGLSAGRRLYDRVALITRAVSLGDTATLITHPASTTHASLSPEQRRAAGLSEGLLRLSVGLESGELLWRDLEQGLSGCSANT